MNGNKSKLKALVSEGRASVIAMQNAYRELAVEFLEKKRAANWKVINDAWVGASKFWRIARVVRTA